MRKIALTAGLSTENQLVIKGVNNNQGRLWLPINSSIDAAGRAAITLLAGGGSALVVDIDPELGIDRAQFYAPGRHYLKLKTAETRSMPTLMKRANEVGQMSFSGMTTGMGRHQTVYTDASRCINGAAVGWVSTGGHSRIEIANYRLPSHILEMQAIVAAVETTRGSVEVFSDCKGAMMLITGEAKGKGFKNIVGDLRDRYAIASKDRQVTLSWVKAHGRNWFNIQVDTLVHSAALSAA